MQSITVTDVRALVRLLQERLAPRTAWHIHGLLATILRAAVQDGWLAASPCRRTAPPRPRRVPVSPLSVGQVQALLSALPAAYRVAGLLGAGCGLRVGGGTRPDRGQRRCGPGTGAGERAVAGRIGVPRLLAPKSQASICSVPQPDGVAVGIDQHPASCPVRVTAALAGLLIRNSRGSGEQ